MDKRPVYTAPGVLKIRDLKQGAGLCTTGSGDAEGCTNGRTAAGLQGCSNGESATAGDCEAGTAANWMCISNGSSPVGMCELTGSNPN